MHIPKEDIWFWSKKDMLAEIIVLLGGRAAEDLVLDDISNGASSDLKRATGIAREMVAKYGMSDEIGPVCYDSDEEVFLGRDFGHSRAYSETIATVIDKEVEKLIKAGFQALSMGDRVLRWETAAMMALGLHWWKRQHPGAAS